MLSNVIADYLDKVSERDFDLPLLHLLPALGFYDVHFVHGPVEFGKDIIAKRSEDGAEVQYSIQSKAGNITPRKWREEVQGQLQTALWTTLGHPNFDKSLSHQVVLVCTGELRRNAAIEFQSFNEGPAIPPNGSPVRFWGKRELTDLLIRHGLDSVHRTTAEGIGGFSRFFALYSNVLAGTVAFREIEEYSRFWSSAHVDSKRRFLLSALESSILAQECKSAGMVFESIQFQLTQLRLLCEAIYLESDTDLRGLWDESKSTLCQTCSEFIAQFSREWSPEKNLVKTWFGQIDHATYLVQCSRILELACLAYFLEDDTEKKQHCGRFVCEFIEWEPGCSRPLSDKYAVSIVFSCLVLFNEGFLDEAIKFINNMAVWICDRYEQGIGLASIEADEYEEISAVFGHIFDFVKSPQGPSSFLATTLIDLAAFLGNKQLFDDIVNDLIAAHIVAEYWQPQDSLGSCRVEGSDVVTYPSVELRESARTPLSDYAEHITTEPDNFKFVNAFGAESIVALSCLLRDRYFPKVWQSFVHHPSS
jgi:hypothetical protein